MALRRTASKCLGPSQYLAAWKFSEEWSANFKVTKIIHDFWSFSYCENGPFIIFWGCWTPDSISNLCFHCRTSEKKYHILRVYTHLKSLTSLIFLPRSIVQYSPNFASYMLQKKFTDSFPILPVNTISHFLPFPPKPTSILVLHIQTFLSALYPQSRVKNSQVRSYQRST